MSNNSLRVPNNSLRVQKGGVFTNIAVVLLAIFILIGWPAIAVILMMKGSVEGYKARQAPPPAPPPKKNKNNGSFYLGLTMIIMWAFMIFAILAKFSS
jgi:hypothetical protein